MRFFLFIALLISILITVFTMYNSQDVTLNFVQWEFTRPLPLILAVPFIAGVVGGIAMIIPLWWKKSKAVRVEKRKVEELEEKVAQLSRPEKEPTETETADISDSELPDTLDTGISEEQKEV